MNYTIHTAMKCSDGEVHRLSYDIVSQTEGSVQEFGRFLAEVQKRFPDVEFWIQENGMEEAKPVTIYYKSPTNTLGFNKEITE